jgi:UDP-N-acetylmuramate dehydrogenase
MYEIPVTVLGQLSNTLISDDGVEGLVIITEKMDEIEINGNEVTAHAGIDMIAVSEFAMQHSLSGLEWAAGLPGSVGGAVFMNAGAYGGMTSETLKSVVAVNRAGEVIELSNADLGFDYRMSIIQRDELYIMSAVFQLQPGDKEEIRSWMDDFNQRRASKQPLSLPSNGSVFKRPEGYFAGKLISDAGLMGVQIGGAKISNKHAIFIVNVDNATAQDYLDVIDLVKKTIKSTNNIDMELEIKIIGKK